MNNGLKNLQSAARSASRRERLETGHPSMQQHGYDDDSGISGIGVLTPVDDQLDASYSSPETSASSNSGHSSAHSVGGYGSAAAYPMTAISHAHAHQAHHTYSVATTAAQGYATGSTGALSSSLGSSHSSTAAAQGYSHHAHPHHHHHHHQPSPVEPTYMANGQRMSSVDMGIEAIINRTPHTGAAGISGV